MLLIVIQKHWWPKTGMFGVCWCLAGIPLTVVGGINCHPTNNDTMTPSKNDCYYDIDGDKGGLYKAMSICLLVIHIFSFFLFFISMCPFDTMKKHVIDDPKPKPQPKIATAPPNTATPSTSTGNNAGANNVATTAASAALSASDLQQAGRKRELDARAEELEKKSKRLADQQRELDRRQQEFTRDSHVSLYPPPPPPSYNVAMETSTSIGQPVQPVGRLPPIDIEKQ